MRIFFSFILLLTIGLLIGQPLVSNAFNETEKEESRIVENNNNIFDNGLAPLPDEKPKVINPLPLPNGSPPLVKKMPTTPRKYSQRENQVTHLDLIQRPFNPNFIEFYTGKPKGIKEYTVDDVPVDVYVNAVKTHSGKQLFTIFSKIELSNKQILNAQIEENTLKIFVANVKSHTDEDEQLVYQTISTEAPTKYEVFRNGKLEKSTKIVYGVE